MRQYLTLFIFLLLIVIICITISEQFLEIVGQYVGVEKKNTSITDKPSFRSWNISSVETASSVTARYRIPVALCSHWHYRVSTGTFPAGAPFIRVQDVCVRDTLVWFLFPSQEESKGFHECLWYCCDPMRRNTKECSRLRIPRALCENLSLFMMRITVSNQTTDDLLTPLLSGRSYLLDTAIGMRYHFGHTVSKLLQLYLLNEKFQHVLINRVDRLPGGFHHGINETNIRNLYDITVGAMDSSIILAQNNITCVEELWWVPNYEQMFFSMSAAKQWRALLHSRYGLTFQKCPPSRAFFLQRTEGMRRRVINSFVVDELAEELNVTLQRAYIGSANTTLEHIQLFSSFGLLISTHSSALKTLIFTNPNAVVVEITGNYIPDWRESPFQLGTQFLDIHYIPSKGHTANWSSCAGHCRPPDMDRDADLIVNKTALRNALVTGLAKQRRHCPEIQFS